MATQARTAPACLPFQSPDASPLRFLLAVLAAECAEMASRRHHGYLGAACLFLHCLDEIERRAELSITPIALPIAQVA